VTARQVDPRARTIFLGTGEFAVPVASALAEHPSVELLAVVTAPRRDGARAKLVEPPVAQWAADNNVLTFRPHRLRSSTAVERIRDQRPDLLVLADYGQIVPGELLELPPHGALNLHPSLLPLHRGATPIPAAILGGDAETGVTLMRMDEGLDTGPIIAQWRVKLSGKETAPELEAQLADQAARLLSATLPHWLNGEITPEPQPHKGGTLTRPLRRARGRLDPALPVAQLERQVRAYQPWPGSFLDTDAGRLIVWRAHPADAPQTDAAVGTLLRTSEGHIGLRVSDGILVLDELQPAGGRRMSAAELVRGRPALIGMQVAAPAEAET
jgi:methionyl-tRNA formyltransferase